MRNGPNLALIASLIGDPARANMLVALLSGQALTASELANHAGITPQTASFHLTRLEEGSLVIPRKQGRHKYFSLASAEVAQHLEGLMAFSELTYGAKRRPGPQDAAMRKARVCYDHLAGEEGVRLFETLVQQKMIAIGPDGLVLTMLGREKLSIFGINIETIENGARRPCRECLDWSERRSHLAGSMGAALLEAFLARRWMRRAPNSRAIILAPKGEEGLRQIAAGQWRAGR